MIERYLKVKGQWIDTLEEQKQYDRYYYEKNGRVYYYTDDFGIDYEVGVLEDQGSIKITDLLTEFINNNPTKGYKNYLKYCELNEIVPVKKSEFKKRKATLLNKED